MSKTPAEQLSIAISIASKGHEGVLDKGGSPYILHPLHVMNAVAHLGYLCMAAGVLHDTIEDTDTTAQNLRDAGLEENVVMTVLAVSRPNGVLYDDFIKAIGATPGIVGTWARAIKLADIEHNSTVTRLKGVAKKDFDRLQKYVYAYQYLKEV